jgi:two-component system alkaline phosphatase synthesis response regulator PhoP
MKKILIVDDEKEFCDFMKRNLERASEYEVICASDGKSAIALARKQKPDLILLDIMMPGIDGLEVLKKLKEKIETITIPVIMLTAKDEETFKIEAAQAYCEDYITKPVNLELLRVKIGNIFTRSGKK